MADQLKVCWLPARLLSGSTNPPALGAPTPPPTFSGASELCQSDEGAAAPGGRYLWLHGRSAILWALGFSQSCPRSSPASPASPLSSALGQTPPTCQDLSLSYSQPLTSSAASWRPMATWRRKEIIMIKSNVIFSTFYGALTKYQEPC